MIKGIIKAAIRHICVKTQDDLEETIKYFHDQAQIKERRHEDYQDEVTMVDLLTEMTDRYYELQRRLQHD